jgi:hypothetical protein
VLISATAAREVHRTSFHAGACGSAATATERGADLGDVQGPVHPEQEPGTQQVQRRPQQREHQVPKRGIELLRMTLQADQRHRGEGEHLDGHVEVEQVAPEEQAVESGPDAEQQRPEGQRHPASHARTLKSPAACRPMNNSNAAVSTSISAAGPSRYSSIPKGALQPPSG